MTKAYAAYEASKALQPFELKRRALGAQDVLIKILYCGICHSDIHQVDNDWSNSIYPMVPGHEIIGIVTHIGEKVSQFKIGETVGVGCFVDSCRKCSHCQNHLEQYCLESMTNTYNDRERDGVTPTYGGYSENIVVDEHYVLRIPKNLPLDRAAPLLCAGITTFSPLKHWNVEKGSRVGVIGLGGLGHIAVQIAHHLGAHVTVFSHSLHKKQDALRLGADEFIDTQNFTGKKMEPFDFIMHTASSLHQIDMFLSLLKLDATLVVIGIPKDPSLIDTKQLIYQRRNLAGSLIGGIQETQEMLDFCGQYHICADIELIDIKDVNKAYQRMLRSDVHYRFVIDMASL